MPDVEDLRALWEIDLELAGSDQGPIPIITTVAEKTWVWSDLHLGDRGALQAFDRPFGDVDQMNRHVLREWRRRVRSDDTIICLGDVAHPDAWRDRRLVLDIQDCPGKRVLVLGNHDLNRAALREAGFATQQGWRPPAAPARSLPLALPQTSAHRLAVQVQLAVIARIDPPNGGFPSLLKLVWVAVAPAECLYSRETASR